MAAANHAYYHDNIFAPYYHHQNAAIYVYVSIYPQYWVPMYLQYQRPQPYMPCDESWILNDQEEEEEETVLNEEELREWDLLDEELVVYGSIGNDTLSEETISKHLKTSTRDHRHNHPHNADDQICVVCQDCLFQEQVATLDCGHEFHAGCIKNWLMVKNYCPLCKATAIQL